MEQAAVTIDIPPDVADEFEQAARAENITESELFQRMFEWYQSHRNASELVNSDPS
jgi:hypothetical protein